MLAEKGSFFTVIGTSGRAEWGALDLSIVAIFSFVIFLATSTQAKTQKISNDYVIAEILAHDSRIKDLEMSFDQEIGVNTEDKLIQGGTWLYKGERCFYHTSKGNLSWDNSYNGKEVRILRKGQSGKYPTQGTINRDEPRFKKSILSVPYITGRTPFGMSLLNALEAGNANVQDEPVMVDGRECYVVEGHMLTKEKNGVDGMFFKYWLDPKCGFMPRRIEEYAYDDKGTLVSKNIRCEHQLSEVAPGVWFPVSIKEEALKLGTEGQWTQATVNKWKASAVTVNAGVADERFDIQFPPGTYVQDFLHPNSEEYIDYIVTGAADLATVGLENMLKSASAARQKGPSQSLQTENNKETHSLPDTKKTQKSKVSSRGSVMRILGVSTLGIGVLGLAYAAARSHLKRKGLHQSGSRVD